MLNPTDAIDLAFVIVYLLVDLYLAVFYPRGDTFSQRIFYWSTKYPIIKVLYVPLVIFLYWHWFGW
jgi:hypothetical protein